MRGVDMRRALGEKGGPAGVFTRSALAAGGRRTGAQLLRAGDLAQNNVLDAVLGVLRK